MGAKATKFTGNESFDSSIKAVNMRKGIFGKKRRFAQKFVRAEEKEENSVKFHVYNLKQDAHDVSLSSAHTSPKK